MFEDNNLEQTDVNLRDEITQLYSNLSEHVQKVLDGKNAEIFFYEVLSSAIYAFIFMCYEVRIHTDNHDVKKLCQEYQSRASILLSNLYQKFSKAHVDAWVDSPLFVTYDLEIAKKIVSTSVDIKLDAIYTEPPKIVEESLKKWEKEGKNIKQQAIWADSPLPY